MVRLSGIWKWNDTIPCVVMPRVDIKFSNNYGYFSSIEFLSVSPGGAYDTVAMHYDPYDTSFCNLIACFGTADSPDKIVVSEKARTMDFTVGGEVSEEFYNYLVANAQCQDMKKIKGRWLWNETIQPIPFMATVGANVEFVSNGELFKRVSSGTGLSNDHCMTYLPKDATILIGKAVSNGVTMKSEYRLIDFGETEQEVDVRFYDYLVANAEYQPTIAEKLTQIAENEPKVYDAGYNKGKAEGDTEGYNRGHATGYEEGKAEGIEEGKQSEYDAFWDHYQKNGNRTYYDNAFADGGNEGGRWRYNVTYKPKYPIKPISAMNMYSYSALPYEAIAAVDFSKCKDFYCCFNYYKGGTQFPPLDLRVATRTQNLFGWSTKIQEVEELWVAESTPYQAIFGGCTNLTEVRFNGTIGQNGLSFKDSTLLSKASIENIIGCLSDTTTGLTVTFALDSVTSRFDSMKEWEELMATKPNWTIALA